MQTTKRTGMPFLICSFFKISNVNLFISLWCLFCPVPLSPQPLTVSMGFWQHFLKYSNSNPKSVQGQLSKTIQQSPCTDCTTHGEPPLTGSEPPLTGSELPAPHWEWAARPSLGVQFLSQQCFKKTITFNRGNKTRREKKTFAIKKNIYIEMIKTASQPIYLYDQRT